MKLFLSHISEEGPLAVALQKWIELAYDKQPEIFVSSNIINLPAGSQWLASLEKALAEADMLIVLCSPHSVNKPWVMFESGGAWVKKIPIIPICHSKQKKDKLPSPLSFFQGLEVSSPHFVPDLFKSLSKQLKLKTSTTIDQKLMLKEIRSAIRKIKWDKQEPSTTQKLRKRIALNQKNKTILKKIATTDNEKCTGKKLARSLKIPAAELDILLRYLKNHKLIRKVYVKDADPYYRTTKIGLDYLVRRKLI